MRRHDQANGFWASGSSIFQSELARQEQARLAPLKAELKETADAQRRIHLEQEIAAIKAEFQTKRKSARHSLFART